MERDRCWWPGVEDAWLEDHLLRFDNLQRLTLAVAVNSLEQWVSIERTLKSMTAVAHVELLVLRRDSAEIKLDFYGDEDRLAIALDQRGLVLEPLTVTIGGSGSQGFAAPLASDGFTPLRVLRPRES